MDLTPPHFPERTEENIEKSLTISGDPGDIWTKHLSNASLQLPLYHPALLPNVNEDADQQSARAA